MAAKPWRAAKSLEVLRYQINSAFPGRNEASDGLIGDTAHAATKSEHNPDANGVVRALDITHDPAHGVDCGKIIKAIVASRDRRVLYVIWEAQICSSVVRPWVWRPYTGSNPHTKHFHMSVVDDPARYDNEAPWAIGTAAIHAPPPPSPTPPPVKPDAPSPPPPDVEPTPAPEPATGFWAWLLRLLKIGA